MSITTPNPYVGPRTFRENESKRFFGRTREARELHSLVLSERLVLFYAQSGAGKSSLLNTNLRPSMKERGFNVLPVGRVGGDAPAGLEVKNIYVFNLLRTLSPIGTDLRKLSLQSMTDFFAELSDKPKSEEQDGEYEKVFLVIDQFEELFSTHHEEWEKREDFFKQLNLTMQDNPNLWVMLSMREDYIASLDPYIPLLAGRLRTRYYMQQLEKDAALDAIRGPVVSEEFSRPYAPGVSEKLVDDLRTISLVMPDGQVASHLGQFVEPLILQVICFDVWENLRSQGQQITAEDLQDVGDVNQFLKNYYAKRMSAVAQAENVSERKIRRWFTEKLISQNGIRNMVLHESGKMSSGLENKAIAALSDLIRTEQRGGAKFYELSHDRLVKLIIEDNQAWELKHASYLQKQADVWAKSGRLESRLLTSSTLVEAETWAKENPNEMTQIEVDFLEASEKRRRIRRRNVFFAIAGGLTTIITLFYFFQSQQATNDAKRQTDVAVSNSLARIALDTLDRQLDLAILLGLEAYGLDPNTQTESTLITISQKAGNLQGFFKVPKGTTAVSLLPEAQGIVTINESGASILNMNGELLFGPFGVPSPAFSSAFSPDGEILAISNKDGSIVLWDVATGERIGDPITLHTDWVNRVVFSADGKTLVSASDDGTIGVWDVTDPLHPRRIRQLALSEGVNDVVLSTNGILAGTVPSGDIYLWDLNNLKTAPSTTLFASTVVFQMAFNADGSLLTYADGIYGTFYLADLSDPKDPKELFEPIAHDFGIYRIAFSPDDTLIALGDEVGNIFLYDLSTPAEPQVLNTFSVHTKSISGLVFSADSKTLISAAEDGQIIFWDVATQKIITKRTVSPTFSNTISLNSSGDRLATPLESGMILIWDVSDIKNPRLIHPLLNDPAPPSHFEVSADKKYLLLFNTIPSTNYVQEFLTVVEIASGTKTEIGAGYLISQTKSGLLLLEDYDDEKDIAQIKFYSLAKREYVYHAIEGRYLAMTSDERILIYETYDYDTSKTTHHLFDLQTGVEVKEPLSGYFIALKGDTLLYSVLDEDGNYIYSEDGLYSILGLWNINTGERREVAGEYIHLLQNGQLIFRRYRLDGIPQIFTTVSAEIEAQELMIYKGNIESQPFLSANEEYIILNFYKMDLAQYEIQMFDTETAKKHEPSIFSNFSPRQIHLSENGRYLLISGIDGGTPKVEIYDAFAGYLMVSTTGELGKSFESENFLVYETYDYSSALNKIHLLNTSTASLQTITGSYIDLIDEGGKLIYYGQNGINVWDTALNKEIITAIQGTYLGVNPDGNTLFTWAQQDDKVLSWDLTKTWSLGDNVNLVSIPSDITAISNNEMLAYVSEDGINLIDTNQVDIQGDIVHSPFNEHISNQITSNDYIFSPDGKLLVYYDSFSKSYILLNLETGELIAKDIPSGFLSFSPSGDYLTIIDDNNNTTSVLDTDSGVLLLENIEGTSVAFSPSGSLLAVGDSSLNTTTVWDAESKRVVASQLAGATPIFSPTGETLAIQNYDLGDITTWDLKTKSILPLTINGDSPRFSPDGNLLAVHNDGLIKVWDLTTQTEISDSLVGSVAVFNAKSNLLLVQDNSNSTFTLWDASQNKILIDGLSGYIPAFSPNGEILAYRIYDKEIETINVWDSAKQEVIWSETGSEYTFSPDSTLLAIGDFFSTTTTKILSLSNGEIVVKDLPFSNYHSFSPDSNHVLLQDYDTYTIILWNRQFNEIVLTVPDGDSAIFSPRGDILMYNLYGEVKLWHLENQTEIPNELFGYYPQFRPDSNTIAIEDFDTYIITFWNISEERNEIEPFNVISNLPESLIFNTNNQKLASIAEDGIILWDVENPASYQRLSADAIKGGTFHDGDTKFVAFNQNGDLLTWDLSKTPPASTLNDNWVPNAALIQQFAFSPNGNYLVYDAGEGRLGAWDLTQNEILPQSESFSEIEESVGSIAFSPDGAYLAYSEAGKIVVYTFPELQKVGELSTGSRQVSDIEIILNDASLKYIVSQDNSGNTQFWDWESRTKAGISMPGYFTLLGSNAVDESFMYIDATDKLIKFNWQLDINGWKNILCPLAQRNFLVEEWNTFFLNAPYPDKTEILTCPNYPSGKTE